MLNATLETSSPTQFIHTAALLLHPMAAAKVDPEMTHTDQQQACGEDRRKRNSFFGKPSWLLCTIADLDERIKLVTLNGPTENNAADSFAARANFYYEERPQLLALLQDLYNSCLSFADRYCRELAKNHHSNDSDSDAESSQSYQPPSTETNRDTIVADLVLRNVDCEFILNELSIMESRWNELLRKMELQQNLLDVLESERLILLNDNATLEYRVMCLAEENKGLAAQSLFLKRRVADLTRCVLKMREDLRVCMLSCKIEQLQEQIYGLEKISNDEYHQDKDSTKKVSLEECLQVRGGGGSRLEKCFSTDLGKTKRRANGQVSKMWERIKKFDLFICAPHLNSTYYC